MGRSPKAIAILAVVLLNATMGYVQKSRPEALFEESAIGIRRSSGPKIMERSFQQLTLDRSCKALKNKHHAVNFCVHRR
jgi:hypothetical protein